MKRVKMWFIVAAGLLCLCTGQVLAAGVLTPVNSADQAIQIRDHHVNVMINNGFAMTEVIQTFYNPNDHDLEAIYSFPLPKNASLSEVTLHVGEREIHGEVLEKEQARQIYEEERDMGHEAGLAEKNEFYTFDFSVHPVPALGETRIRFLYYQPLEIELGVGRYLYPVQEGGTDEVAKSFWTTNSKVENFLSIHVELKSAWPVTKVRAPGYEGVLKVEQKDDGHYLATLEQQNAQLNRDFLFYYKLADDLPGRVELIPYRADEEGPGTFMMVVTPGMDLKRIENGADYTFVLDISGSMSSKIRTLARGVAMTLGEMSGKDRFRIITFNDRARELTSGGVAATKENVAQFAGMVERLGANGSTNLYNGLELALQSLDNDRATSVILVTDAVTNTGVVSPEAFDKLMKQYDVRIFGFLMGNSCNWPLMRVVCDESGGFSAGVSNDDDIIGQILLAKSKVVSECIHDAELKISGVEVHDATDSNVGKIYQGQQLVFFGRYEKGGLARITLKGRMTGEDRTYTTEFDFPEVATDHPEIERLWALNRVEELEYLADIGRLDERESRFAVRDLGIQYQIVTDETSMVVLCDEAFAERSIERLNAERTKLEREARARRAVQPIQRRRADKSKPMFDKPAPSSKGWSVGGGAFDPITVGIALGAAALAGGAVRRGKRRRK